MNGPKSASNINGSLTSTMLVLSVYLFICSLNFGRNADTGFDLSFINCETLAATVTSVSYLTIWLDCHA